MTEASITLTEIRASEISKWLDCPQKALHRHMRVKHRVEPIAHVGSVLGDHVHKELTGHVPTPQHQVIYDDRTPNEYMMNKQVKNCVRAIKEFVDRRNWSVVQTEIPLRVRLSVAKSLVINISGTIDAIVVDEHGNYYLIDYKTGKWLPHKAMSQLAVYAWLAETKKIENHNRIKKVGAIFMERKKLSLHSEYETPLSWGVDYQDAVKEGKEIVYHTAKMATGVVMPYFNPSQFNCHDCDKACNFRVNIEQESAL